MKTIYLSIIISVLLNCSAKAQSGWNQVSGPPYSGSHGRFDDMYFINDSTGFVSQDCYVYKTINKGENWNLISSLDTFNYPYYVRSIEFINDTLGFVGLLQADVTWNGNLFKTIDGGNSWSLIQNMQIQAADGICGMAHYDNRLIAVGTYSGPAWFYRTDDAALTWTKINLSSLASGLVDCFMFNHDTILVSGIADAGNQFKATILKSFDGGLTWQRVYLAPNPTSYCWKMFFRPNGLGVSSIEEGNPIIARTTDFGNTWTTYQVSSSTTTSSLGGIGLLNDTLGWVTDQVGIGTWETHDGGLTWDSIQSPIWSGDRMVILDSTIAVISGWSVYKYEAGVTSIESKLIPKVQIHELLEYPNPVTDKIIVDAIAGKNTFGLLDILDDKGVLVKHIARQLFKKGENSFTVSTIQLPEGNYRILWRNNERFLSTSFIVIRSNKK